MHWPEASAAWFLKKFSVWMSVCMCAHTYVCVCLLIPRLLKTSGLMWHDWISYDWLNKLAELPIVFKPGTCWPVAGAHLVS